MAKLRKLNNEEAEDRLGWLMYGYSSEDLRKAVDQINDIELDAHAIDVLREISHVARELANHYEEKMKNGNSV